MTTIEDRLRSLGDVLDLDDRDVVVGVLARLDGPSARGDVQRRSHPVRIVAAIVLVLALAVALVPNSRRAVADWFGFDGVRIERRPGASVPDRPDPLDRGDAVGTVVTVAGVDVLVSEFDGSLDASLITKVATADTTIRTVVVGDDVGVWIAGEPHQVTLPDAQGRVVFDGFAGNTLLWQDGDVIRRLEGFDDVDAAIDYAVSLGR